MLILAPIPLIQKGNCLKKKAMVMKEEDDEDGAPKHWPNSEVETLIALQREIEDVFNKNAKKKVKP